MARIPHLHLEASNVFLTPVQPTVAPGCTCSACALLPPATASFSSLQKSIYPWVQVCKQASPGYYMVAVGHGTQAKWKPWDIVMRTGVTWLPVECPGTWKSCQQMVVLGQGKCVNRCALLYARLVLMFWMLFSSFLASDRLIQPLRAIYTQGN